MHWPVWEWERHQPNHRPLKHPFFVLFNTLSCSHRNRMNTHKLQYTGVFFSLLLQTNKKNQCFSREEHTYKKINNTLITRRAPFHTLYPLLYGSLQHALYSVLPHLEGTCFPLKVLSPKLCFLGLTMCAASGCNPISQTVKGNAVFNYLAFTSSWPRRARFHSVCVDVCRFEALWVHRLFINSPRQKSGKTTDSG